MKKYLTSKSCTDTQKKKPNNNAIIKTSIAMDPTKGWTELCHIDTDEFCNLTEKTSYLDYIENINIKKNITGKKINSVEVLIKVASDNQNQN